MKPLSLDTPPEVEEMLLEGYRRMSPAEKMRRVLDLNETVRQLAIAGIRDRHGPDLDPRELELRLAALRLPRETMIEVFDWDPEVHGY